MANVGKTLQGNMKRNSSSWTYQDQDRVIRSVQDIMKGGNGQMETYNPSLMTKVNQTLNMVDDYAHGVSQEEIDEKYNSMPSDFKDTVKTTSQGVNIKGSMTNYELTQQAKNYGVKLSDSEKELLQERPGIQKQYLEIKKKSSNIDNKQMEAMMGTILNDIQTGKLGNKNQLRARLMQYLNMGTPDDLDYLTDDLWSVFTSNKTNNQKMDRVRTKYRELFGFEDRTGWQKAEESGLGLLNGLEEAVVNGVHWLSEAVTDSALYIGKQTAKTLGQEDRVVPADVNLWDIDEESLSPETREMVEKLREYGLGAGVVSAMDVYFDALEETTDAKLDEFFKDASYPYKDNSRDSERLRESSDIIGVSEFVGKTIPELYVTSKIGAMIPMSAVKNAPWYLKLGYRMMRSGVEGTAFEAMEEGEVDPMNVAIYSASSLLVEPLLKTIGRKIERYGIKNRFGKGWNEAVSDVMNQGEKNAVKNAEEKYLKQTGKEALTASEKEIISNATSKGINTSRSDAEKYIVDKVAEALPNEFSILGASNVLDTTVKSVETSIKGIQSDITKELGNVTKKYKNTYVKDMLEKVFGQADQDIAEAYSTFRNARIGAGMSEEAVAEEWKMMEKLYKDGASEFSLLDQEKMKQNMRTIHDTYSKSASHKPLAGLEPSRWRDQQISAQNLIKGYAEENGIKNLSDLYLQESVLIRAKDGFGSNATKSMSDIINRYAGRTLVGGLGAYTASQTIGEGTPFSNPYVATASTLLVMAMGGSPRVSLAVSKLSNRLSMIEARAIINSAEDGTLYKWDASKIGTEGITEHFHDVLYADSIKYLVDEMEGNTNYEGVTTTQQQGLRPGVMNAIKQEYGLY